MATINVPPSAVSRGTGVSIGPTFDVQGDTSDGNAFLNAGRELLIVRNDNVASKVFELYVVGTLDGMSVNNPSYTIAGKTTKVYGPFHPSLFNQSSAGVENKVKIKPDSTDVYFQVITVTTV